MTVHWGYNRCPPKNLLPNHEGGYCCMKWDEVRQDWVLVDEASDIHEKYRAPDSKEIWAEIRAEMHKERELVQRYLRHGERLLTHCRLDERQTTSG